MATLPPPPLDNALAQRDGLAAPPWARWLQLLRDDSIKRVRAMAVASAVQAIPNTTHTAVRFDAVGLDTHLAITTGAGWKFTAPLDGAYRISAIVSLNYAPPGADFATLLVRKNGLGGTLANPDYRLDLDSGWASADIGLSGSVMLELLAGDYVQAMAYQNSGSSQNTTFGVGEHRTHISIDRLP